MHRHFLLPGRMQQHQLHHPQAVPKQGRTVQGSGVALRVPHTQQLSPTLQAQAIDGGLCRQQAPQFPQAP